MLRVVPLPSGVASVPVARAEARDFAHGICPDRALDVETIASELVTNVIRHARVGPATPLAMILEHGDGGMRLSVRDRGPGFDAPPGKPGRDQVSGWGLYLVERLADRWGFERQPDGFVVWAEIGSPMGHDAEADDGHD